MPRKLLDYHNFKSGLMLASMSFSVDVNPDILLKTEKAIKDHLGLKDDEPIPIINYMLPENLDPLIEELGIYVNGVLESFNL